MAEIVELNKEGFAMQSYYINQKPELKRLLRDNFTVTLELDSSMNIKKIHKKPFAPLSRSNEPENRRKRADLHQNLNF